MKSHSTSKNLITRLTFSAIGLAALCGCSIASKLNASTASDQTDSPCEIVIEHLTLGDTPMPDLSAVEKAVSQITLSRIGCTVKIENIPISDHATRISLMSAQNDQLDIINTGRTVSLAEMAADGIHVEFSIVYLLPKRKYNHRLVYFPTMHKQLVQSFLHFYTNDLHHPKK